jgi:hypothetical protein
MLKEKIVSLTKAYYGLLSELQLHQKYNSQLKSQLDAAAVREQNLDERLNQANSKVNSFKRRILELEKESDSKLAPNVQQELYERISNIINSLDE